MNLFYMHLNDKQKNNILLKTLNKLYDMKKALLPQN